MLCTLLKVKRRQARINGMVHGLAVQRFTVMEVADFRFNLLNHAKRVASRELYPDARSVIGARNREP